MLEGPKLEFLVDYQLEFLEEYQYEFTKDSLGKILWGIPGGIT